MKIGQLTLGEGAAYVEEEGGEGRIDALEKEVWNIKQVGECPLGKWRF